jgi:hypothetical protein
VTAYEYGYGPQTDEERAANEQAVREAVEIVTLSYLGREGGRPRNRRLRDLEDRAARLARHYAAQDRKRGRP